VVFGPVPRSHAHELPKKVRRAALRSALSLRLKEGALLAVDALALPQAKTREMVQLLGRLGLDGSASVLIVVAGSDAGVERAARNLPWARVLKVAGLNVYDVLRYKRLLVTREALDAIHARLGDVPAEEARS
jgi:large subunit ribosomal protein L4